MAPETDIGGCLYPSLCFTAFATQPVCPCSGVLSLPLFSLFLFSLSFFSLSPTVPMEMIVLIGIHWGFLVAPRPVLACRYTASLDMSVPSISPFP